MKKLVLLFAACLVLLLPMSAWADNHMGKKPEGGYTGPSAAEHVTVAAALKMSDDSPVVLQGKLVKHLGHDKYEFKDDSGSMTVEIDNKIWSGQNVSGEDLVEIRGKVDKDLTKTTIDVDQVIKK